MIVNNFHIIGRVSLPPETDSELIVHPDAVLSLTIMQQSFQAISRWFAQILQFCRYIKLRKFPNRRTCNCRELAACSSLEQSPSFVVGERLDHILSV